jgi:hypothetical protein
MYHTHAYDFCKPPSESLEVIAGVNTSDKILVGKAEWNRPLGRPRHRWGDNIKVDLEGMGCDHVDCIHFVQERVLRWALVNTVMNLWVPLRAGNFLNC